MVATLGSISSQAMNLSAFPSIRQIVHHRSTLSFPAFPFVIGTIASFGGIAYAILAEQWIVLFSTLCSMSVNAICLTAHVRFSRKSATIIASLLRLTLIECIVMMIGPVPVCTFAQSIACGPFTRRWVGFMCTGIYCLVYCGQLTTFKEVIATKNSASISPWMTAGTLLCAAVWTWYAILVSDWFYLTSSLVGDLSGLIQMVLIVRYPAVKLSGPESDPLPLTQSTIGVKAAANCLENGDIGSSPMRS